MIVSLNEYLTKQNIAKLFFLLALNLGELYGEFNGLKVKNCVVSKSLVLEALLGMTAPGAELRDVTLFRPRIGEDLKKSSSP